MEMNLRMVVAAVQELQRQVNQLEQKIDKLNKNLEHEPLAMTDPPGKVQPFVVLRAGSPLDRG